jgi:hypothetical protein
VTRERLQAHEIVDRQEVVDERQRRLHAARQGLVLGRAQQRIQPDDAPGAARKAGHFPGEREGRSAIPSVGHQQDDRTAAAHATCPCDVVGAQRVADARASAVIADLREDA